MPHDSNWLRQTMGIIGGCPYHSTLVPSITTTLPQFGQALAGNRFAEGKATKLSSTWAGRHEEVLTVLFL